MSKIKEVNFPIEFQNEILSDYNNQIDKLNDLKYLVSKKDISINELHDWNIKVCAVHNRLINIADKIYKIGDVGFEVGE